MKKRKLTSINTERETPTHQLLKWLAKHIALRIQEERPIFPSVSDSSKSNPSDDPKPRPLQESKSEE